MATAQDALRTAADKLDDAFKAYARENDGLAAWDYQGEGFSLAEEAFRNGAPEGPADWIDGEVGAFPESARYLIACAAAYRLAELESRRSAPMERAA